MKSVAIAIFPGVQALDVVAPFDVLIEANRFISPEAQYKVVVVGAERGPVRAFGGLTLFVEEAFDDAQRFDLVLVAGGPSLPVAPPQARLTAWLQSVAPHCERYGSICTGAFALGRAGLLNGRRVTTHWQHAKQLAEQFRSAKVDLDKIYIRDGKLITSAGVTAGIDLTLALVTEDHGSEIALAVAKRLVVFAHRQGGQSQFSPFLSAPIDENSLEAQIHAYVVRNIRDKFTVRQLADVVTMSSRNFARVFVQQTRVTPREFVERARVDYARTLLEVSENPLKVVAWESGFGTADQMRVVFSKHLGVTPNQYRERFRRESA